MAALLAALMTAPLAQAEEKAPSCAPKHIVIYADVSGTMKDNLDDVLKGLGVFFDAALARDDKVTINVFGEKPKQLYDGHPGNRERAMQEAEAIRHEEVASKTQFELVLDNMAELRRREDGQITFVIASDFAHDNMTENCTNADKRRENFESATQRFFADADLLERLKDHGTTSTVLIQENTTCTENGAVAAAVLSRIKEALDATVAQKDAQSIANALLSTVHATVTFKLDPSSALGPADGKLTLIATNLASAAVATKTLVFNSGSEAIRVDTQLELSPCATKPWTVQNADLQKLAGQPAVKLNVEGTGIDDKADAGTLSFKAIRISDAKVDSYRPPLLDPIWSSFIDLQVESEMKATVTVSVDGTAVGGERKQYRIDVSPGKSHVVLVMATPNVPERDAPAAGAIGVASTDGTKIAGKDQKAEVADKTTVQGTEQEKKPTEKATEVMPILSTVLPPLVFLILMRRTGRITGVASAAHETVDALHFGDLFEHRILPLLGWLGGIVLSAFSRVGILRIDDVHLGGVALRFAAFTLVYFILVRFAYILRWRSIEKSLFGTNDDAETAYTRVRKRIWFWTFGLAILTTSIVAISSVSWNQVFEHPIKP